MMPRTATFEDRYGLPLTTGSAAVKHYVEGIDRTLAGDAGADAALEAAVQADEGFAMAQVALARSLQFRGLVPQARERAALARSLTGGATPRERGHVETIASAIESGGGPEVLARVREHIDQYPRDAFVLSQATGVYGLIGFSGRLDRNEEQLALLDGLAPAYGDDWWFLSAHAFAYNELFQSERARALVQRSLSLYERNAHGAHTMAHVYFETGEVENGSDFLEPWITTYDRAAQLHCHLSWHLALFEMAAGRYERVLDLYRESVCPTSAQSQPIGKVADAASLLWRYRLYGCGEETLPWEEVRELAAQAFPRPGVTWADMHAMLAFAATGDDASMDRLIDGLRERAAHGKLPAGDGVVALAEGIAAFAHGDYETAAARMGPVAEQIIRLGGSNAQREVFEDTLLEAYLRTNRHADAEAMLRRRLDRRPSPRDQMRLQRAQAGRDEGDRQDAESATGAKAIE